VIIDDLHCHLAHALFPTACVFVSRLFNFVYFSKCWYRSSSTNIAYDVRFVVGCISVWIQCIAVDYPKVRQLVRLYIRTVGSVDLQAVLRSFLSTRQGLIYSARLIKK
jgi:hypothetical protein